MDLIELLGEAPPLANLDRLLPGPYCELHVDGIPVALQVGKTEDGLVCTGLLIGWTDRPTAITARNVRHVKLTETLRSLAAQMGLGVAEDVPSVGVRPRGRPAHPDSHYERIAAFYLVAMETHPAAPVVWMAAHEGVNRGTVQRWLATARARGLLARSHRRTPRAPS